MAQQVTLTEFKPEDMKKVFCKKCGGSFFDKTFHLGEVSKLCPRNKTGQEVTIEFQTYVCRSCGAELYAKET